MEVLPCVLINCFYIFKLFIEEGGHYAPMIYGNEESDEIKSNIYWVLDQVDP